MTIKDIGLEAHPETDQFLRLDAGRGRQVEVVRAVVGEELPVSGVLCFVDTDWPLVGGAFTIRGVEVLWPKRLVSRLTSDGPLDDVLIQRTHRDLAGALPAA